MDRGGLWLECRTCARTRCAGELGHPELRKATELLESSRQIHARDIMSSRPLSGTTIEALHPGGSAGEKRSISVRISRAAYGTETSNAVDRSRYLVGRQANFADIRSYNRTASTVSVDATLHRAEFLVYVIDRSISRTIVNF